ncbi:MAG: SprT-like domain-containing protein [bacterium]
MLQEKLEGQILHGLACEWENFLLILDPPQKEFMYTPLFSLRDMDDRWGCWLRDRREISLSRHLVLNHSWDAVREVLLHEMSHQYADEVLGANGERPHGPIFVKACRLLRANPKTSGDFIPLDKRISSVTERSEDKLLRRIKKLMALAESQNKHEAEAAMAKAQELLLKYNQDIVTENRERDFISVFLGKPALRHSRKEYVLATLLQDFYFIKGIWMPSYVLTKGKMGTVLEISGTFQNVKTASYVFDFVTHFIHSQWTVYNKHKGYNQHRKTDFAVGILEGFRHTLCAQKEEKKGSLKSRALVKIQDPLLIQYFNHKYPHTSKFRRKLCTVDKNVIKDGMSIGKRLVIYKGIGEKKENKGLYLPKNKLNRN